MGLTEKEKQDLKKMMELGMLDRAGYEESMRAAGEEVEETPPVAAPIPAPVQPTITPPPPDIPEWHVVINGAQQGPFNKATLLDKLKAKEITRQAQVWKQGMGDSWAAMDMVEELQAVATQVPPPSAAELAAEKVRSEMAVRMARIEGGTFTMGSPKDEEGRGISYIGLGETQHQVTVSSFYMGRYPVTQKEYQEVTGANPTHPGFKGDNNPVYGVSWFDAVVFCNKLSIKAGLSPAYRIKGSTDPAEWEKIKGWRWNEEHDTWEEVEIVPGSNGYRLPTEAQWEYACRAGTTTAYNTGAEISDDTGWYKANSGGLKPVGLKPANAWGLYDMHGNVREWCWDWCENYPSEAQTDPTGPATGDNRMLRSGSWHDDPDDLRSACRHRAGPSSPNEGFRLVRNGQ